MNDSHDSRRDNQNRAASKQPAPYATSGFHEDKPPDTIPAPEPFDMKWGRGQIRVIPDPGIPRDHAGYMINTKALTKAFRGQMDGLAKAQYEADAEFYARAARMPFKTEPARCEHAAYLLHGVLRLCAVLDVLRPGMLIGDVEAELAYRGRR